MTERQLEIIVGKLNEVIEQLEWQNKLSLALLETVDSKAKQSKMDKSQLQNNISNLLGNIFKNSSLNVTQDEINKGVSNILQGLNKGD